MLSLNQDIIVEIASKLEIDELYACMRVCQSFLKCYDSDKVFIVLLERDFQVTVDMVVNDSNLMSNFTLSNSEATAIDTTNFKYKQVYQFVRKKFAKNREIIDVLLAPDGEYRCGRNTEKHSVAYAVQGKVCYRFDDNFGNANSYGSNGVIIKTTVKLQMQEVEGANDYYRGSYFWGKKKLAETSYTTARLFCVESRSRQSFQDLEDPSEERESGFGTLLHWASLAGRLNIVEYLCKDRNANPLIKAKVREMPIEVNIETYYNKKNDKNNFTYIYVTPYEIAFANGHFLVAKYLKNYTKTYRENNKKNNNDVPNEHEISSEEQY